LDNRKSAATNSKVTRWRCHCSSPVNLHVHALNKRPSARVHSVPDDNKITTFRKSGRWNLCASVLLPDTWASSGQADCTHSRCGRCVYLEAYRAGQEKKLSRTRITLAYFFCVKKKGDAPCACAGNKKNQLDIEDQNACPSTLIALTPPHAQCTLRLLSSRA
jgi:hypothetical protein